MTKCKYHFLSGCGGQLSISDPLAVGNLSSPNYPVKYPTNMECVWVLNVPAGDTIEFNFVDMDIEAGADCRWDYVELRDGGSLGSNSLGKFCGSSLPSPSRYVSTGNQLVVKIRSDASVTGRGFTASWKIGKVFLKKSCYRCISVLLLLSKFFYDDKEFHTVLRSTPFVVKSFVPNPIQ